QRRPEAGRQEAGQGPRRGRPPPRPAQQPPQPGGEAGRGGEEGECQQQEEEVRPGVQDAEAVLGPQKGEGKGPAGPGGQGAAARPRSGARRVGGWRVALHEGIIHRLPAGRQAPFRLDGGAGPAAQVIVAVLTDPVVGQGLGAAGGANGGGDRGGAERPGAARGAGAVILPSFG